MRDTGAASRLRGMRGRHIVKWFQHTADPIAKVAAPTVPPPPASPSVVDDDAVDTLATVLRLLGQYSLGVDHDEAAKIRDESEGWARHVLVCDPAPGVASAAATSGRRYWSEVRRFATRVRKDEFDRISGSMGQLRQAVWAVVDGMAGLLTEGKDTDNDVLLALDELRGTVEKNAPSDLHEAVQSAVGELARVIQARKANQEAQLEVLGQRVSALAEELQEVRRESTTDELTQLFNRRAFEDYLDRTGQLRHGFGQPACLLFIDIDEFKQVNDRFGHPTGDAVLRGLADAIVRTFPRRSDLASRFGGDEFGVILSGTRLREGIRLAERLLSGVRELRSPSDDNVDVTFTISVGVSEVGERESTEAWLKRTDDALYEAKRTGRNRFWSADDPLPVKTDRE